MKMPKNELEVDASATSRIPIPSPPSTKRVDAPRYAARPPARPVHDPHAEAVAVAVAEPVDEVTGLRKTEKKDIKTVVSLPPSQNVWPLWTRDVWQMSRRPTPTYRDSTIITST